MARPVVDLAGQRFGRLVALRLADEQRVGRHARWVVRCDCGAEALADSSHLRRGDKRSCGCLSAEVGARLRAISTKHGGVGTVEYLAWRNMVARCEQKTATGYANYGGRGIRVCAAWRHDFSAFLAHIGPRPSSDHSVDRIDNDRGYEPGNVRWATRDVQNANRRPRRALVHA